MGLPVTCGIGNIAILSHAFAGALQGAPKPKLQMLCHYQNIAAWRRPRRQRAGPPRGCGSTAPRSRTSIPGSPPSS